MTSDQPQPVKRNQSIIVDRGVNALIQMKRNAEYVLGRAPPDLTFPPGYIISDPVMAGALADIAANLAVAFNCLFDVSEKRSSENSRYARARLERTRPIVDALGGRPLSALRSRGVRNAIEHMDERLVKIIVDEPPGPWISTLALSTYRIFRMNGDPTLRMIQVYIYETDEFVVLGEKMNLKPLLEEIEFVFNALGLQPEYEPLK